MILHNTEWDCCVVGNGVSALWVSHWLWSARKSVLWITSEEPYSPERAMLQHGWAWGIDPAHAAPLTGQLQGFENGGELPALEAIYFDARSSKRFRRFGEARQEFGDHERDFYASFARGSDVDLWDWHARLHRFHDTGSAQGPTRIELFREPRFVRAQNWPVLELKTAGGRITGAVLAGPSARAQGASDTMSARAQGASGMVKPGESMEIRATRFYLGDYDEYLPGLVKTESDSQALAAAFKGRAYRAGFGLRLWHRELATTPTQTAVIPLIVNPGEGDASHVVGRFVPGAALQSYWVGLLTDEELEDNNEILKRIKQTKRAIERAVPGFIESIEREAVTFELRMRAVELVKNRKSEALGAALFSDQYGADFAAEAVKKIFSGGEGDQKTAKRGQGTSRPVSPELGA